MLFCYSFTGVYIIKLNLKVRTKNTMNPERVEDQFKRIDLISAAA